MKFKTYVRAEQVVDTALFDSDRLPFLVLTRIVNQKAKFVITDHERFVICYSTPPYPVWIWVPDDFTEEEKEELWQLCKEEHILPGQFWTGSKQNISGETEEPPISGINMKYALANYFIRRGKEEGCPLVISLRLLVYDCPVSALPEKTAEGTIALMTEEDLEDVAEFLYQFKQETGVDMEDRETCLEKAKHQIGQNNFFLWKNTDGKTVAMCGYQANQGLGSIGSVYCCPEERRKGYAGNLVYQVTEKIREEGLLPVLYTDGDYEASNGCYQKIGYQKKGELCMLGQDRMEQDRQK